MKQIPSPNFEERKPGIPLCLVVMHFTGMETAEAAITRMCDPATKVSAHYTIMENGDIVQLVDESKRAFHAGQSYWRGITDVNSASIGIELINPGHDHGYRPFPAAQIKAAMSLAQDIVTRHGMDPRMALVGHSDVAPVRRKDPGELFPWKEFADAGMGFWPAPRDYSPATDAEILKLFHEIGYETVQPYHTVLAFQRHYYPENLTGVADNETVARARALRALMP